MLEYSSATGVTRSLVKGGAKYHQMLLKAFADHLLHVKLDAHRLLPPTLDLSVLRLGFDVPPRRVTDRDTVRALRAALDRVEAR